MILLRWTDKLRAEVRRIGRSELEPDSRVLVNRHHSIFHDTGIAARHSGMVRRTRPQMCNCTSGNRSFHSRPGTTRKITRQSYRNPVPPQRWHFTTLSPFLSRPLPSQFLHFCFFLMLGPFSLAMITSRRGCSHTPTKAAFSIISKAYSIQGP